jgi:hypothetical protein
LVEYRAVWHFHSSPPPGTFLEDVPKGLRGLLAMQVIATVGLWGVKFNFLLFFYRIFCSVDRMYRYLWWVVVVVTVLSFGAFLGLDSYKCTASDVMIIVTECTKPSATRLEWIQVQTTSTIDAINDVLSTKLSLSPPPSCIFLLNLLL